MRSLSLRTRVLLLVLGVGLLPLILIGWWIAGAAARSGETLVRSRLVDALSGTASNVAERWAIERSALLDFADDGSVQGSLRSGRREALDAQGISLAFERLGPAVAGARLLDSAGVELWSAERGSEERSPQSDRFRVSLTIYERGTPRRLGTLRAAVHLTELLGDRNPPMVTGGILAAVDRPSGATLLPAPFEVIARGSRFVLFDEPWVAERVYLREPEVDLIAAAPLTTFVQPLERATRQGLSLLLAVGLAGLLLTAWLSTRLTGALGRLASAAEGISQGDLERSVEVRSSDEVGRLAAAFNTMTESLRRTLRELANRESLAAVGAFASDLAHEVRNPLSAIRVDLQVVEERVTADPAASEALGAALAQVDRLERTVSGVLELARSGKVELQTVDLRAPAEASIRAARPSFQAACADLVTKLPDEPLVLRGDADALEQMMLNLLINAAQALPPGGRAVLEATCDGAAVLVRIQDDGLGMSAADLARVREPFFSGRKGGTGLGVGIAERIARAHGGEFTIESAPGAGTIVEIRLPIGIEHPSEALEKRE
jgi:signal transduction histidine kinase